ncbi:hypothetical protein [Cysteiniphilum sp. QT6929]|uniref:hypothetical protein n=1 Tax=Cysteiniphilum sp. QT6929 TaxID=2975055 RepID=UPI0024B37406|nr:hypothetical protein [Cysteiniphilum sp. QT6929]WHN65297.1 hypothetical protein NYP54_09645 [Cysteiniphilum sp. QT6929]
MKKLILLILSLSCIAQVQATSSYLTSPTIEVRVVNTDYKIISTKADNPNLNEIYVNKMFNTYKPKIEICGKDFKKNHAYAIYYDLGRVYSSDTQWDDGLVIITYDKPCVTTEHNISEKGDQERFKLNEINPLDIKELILYKQLLV